MNGDVIHSQRAAEPVGAFPHARRAGDLLFLSGIGPRVRGSSVIPGTTLGPDGQVVAHDIAAQCLAAFDNVRWVLADAGARWQDLVDVTVYLTDMARDFPTYDRLWAEHFAGVACCRTTLEVNRLPTPIAIELKCVAYVPRRESSALPEVP